MADPIKEPKPSKPTRKYTKKVYKKSKSSRRLQGKPPPDNVRRPEGANGAVFATILSTLFTTMAGLDKNHNYLKLQLKAFWPNQLEDLEGGNKNTYRTVHAVIAASVLANYDLKEVNSPISNTCIHQKDLPKLPKTWNDLRRHPYGA